jgi:hypothetical protein
LPEPGKPWVMISAALLRAKQSAASAR